MLEHNQPLFSIIIVSYNTRSYLNNCLNSINQHLSNLKPEIIVVDNGSTDGSLELLKNFQKKGKIKLINLKNNLGFGTANNRGAAIAKGKYLLFLNSDTLLVEDPVTAGFNYLDKNQDTAVYSCQLRNQNGEIQPTGGYFPNLTNIFAWQFFIDDLPLISSLIKSVHPQSNLYHRSRYFDWLTGAFMLVPKELFLTVNGFDESIFMYAEELELCYRFSRIGKKCFYQPKNKIIHYGGGSGGSRLAITLEIKNILYFFKKHSPKWQLTCVKLIFRCGCLLRWFLFGIIKGNDTAQKAYLEAYRNLA